MILFVYECDVVEFRDPLLDYGPEEPPRQRTWVSGGGVMRVATLGDPDLVLKMSFRDVSDAQWQAMRTFIQDTINYAAESFSYVDPLGTLYTGMRYVSGIETWRWQRRAARWHGSLTIRQDLGV
jgi:hypothetical protein